MEMPQNFQKTEPPTVHKAEIFAVANRQIEVQQIHLVRSTRLFQLSYCCAKSTLFTQQLSADRCHQHALSYGAPYADPSLTDSV